MKNTHQKIAGKIALNVKALRKSRGITQEEFADFAEIDRTYASQIERAIANPSLSVLCKVADVFDVDLKELLN
jgi:transcriptional regulator with XRE-family HTH domain